MSNKHLVIVVVAAFSLGFLTQVAFSALPTTESPLGHVPIERSSPSDTIKEEDILVYKNGAIAEFEYGNDEYLVKLNLADPSWSTFLDTNSMDPVLDAGANAIRIQVPCDEIQVGDIITYKHDEYGLIIHRVIVKDNDEHGRYFVLKGDNNELSDPGKVRCEQIQGKLVALFY